MTKTFFYALFALSVCGLPSAFAQGPPAPSPPGEVPPPVDLPLPPGEVPPPVDVPECDCDETYTETVSVTGYHSTSIMTAGVTALQYAIDGAISVRDNFTLGEICEFSYELDGPDAARRVWTPQFGWEWAVTIRANVTIEYCPAPQNPDPEPEDPTVVVVLDPYPDPLFSTEIETLPLPPSDPCDGLSGVMTVLLGVGTGQTETEALAAADQNLFTQMWDLSVNNPCPDCAVTFEPLSTTTLTLYGTWFASISVNVVADCP